MQLNPNTTYCGPPPTYCNTTIQKVECEHPEGYSYRANISGWNSIGKNESVIVSSTHPYRLFLPSMFDYYGTMATHCNAYRASL